MAAVLEHWREASTLILVSQRGRGENVVSAPTRGDAHPDTMGGKEFDVLLLKRSGKSGFMPNVYVFPGGIADDADFSSEWIEIFDAAGTRWREEIFAAVQSGGPGAPMFSRQRPEQFRSIPSEIAFRLCAIRETFEESGILLARRVVDAKRTSYNRGEKLFGNAVVLDATSGGWRERVTQDARQFASMCRELSLVPDVEALCEWSNWLTPVSLTRRGGRRYDTAFFLCCLETRPEATHDQVETIHSQWGSPADILLQSTMKKMGVAPPQRYELARLLSFPHVSELCEFLCRRSEHRVPRFFPVLISCQDALLSILPGDDLYPSNPDFYGDAAQIIMEETEEELAKQYPRMHRTVIPLNDSRSQDHDVIKCNIHLPGHVAPVSSKFHPPTAHL